jgi:hypothetical protein
MVSAPPDGFVRILGVQRMLDPASGEATALVEYETAGGNKQVHMTPLRAWDLNLIAACREGLLVPVPTP